MKTPLAIFGLLALLPAAQATEQKARAVAPDLALVASAGKHRLLAFQECSEENCWHRFYVQELGLSPARRLICSKAVPELNRSEASMASNAQWRAGAFGELELSLHSPQDEFVPYTATLTFAPHCLYVLRPAAPPPLEVAPAPGPPE